MNIPGFNTLTPEERALVEWQYRLTGDFKTALWKAITLADDDNLERLAQGFPVEVRAYMAYTRQRGYWQSVVKKAGGDVEAGY